MAPVKKRAKTAGTVPARKPAPDHTLICPITLTLMVDPVMTEAGITYERTAILKHFRITNTDPVTRKILIRRKGKQILLIPNIAIRSQIDDYVTTHGAPPEWTDLLKKMLEWDGDAQDEVIRLVRLGVDPNTVYGPCQYNLLFYAISHLNKTLWELLIQKGIDKNGPYCTAEGACSALERLRTKITYEKQTLSGNTIKALQALDKAELAEKKMNETWRCIIG